MKSERYQRVVAPAGFDGHPKRHPYYCKSKSAAADLRWRIRKWKTDRKTPGLQVVEITEYDQNWIGYLKNRLPSLDLLPGVIDHWERTVATVTNRVTVQELRERFIEFKCGETDSHRTRADIRTRLNGFCYQFGQRPAHEITTPELRTYLQSLPKGYSRRNAFKWLRPMFEFGKENRMLGVSPFDGIARPEGSNNAPRIHQPSEFERLLNTADVQFPELLPYIALEGAGFLRSCELVHTRASDLVLDWSDIDFEKRLIHVRPGVAKDTRSANGNARHPKMEDIVAHWLEPHRKYSGPVVEWGERYFRTQLKELYIAANVAPVPNALRKSCMSYAIAWRPEIGVVYVSKQAGNSEAVARRYYIETLEPSAGEAWFGIRRAE